MTERLITLTIPCELSYESAVMDFEFDDKLPKELRQPYRKKLSIAENTDGERWSCNFHKTGHRSGRVWRLIVRHRIGNVLARNDKCG